jgi:hypothetical protein
MALIDHRDAAEAGLRVLTDAALWGAHHDLTGLVIAAVQGHDILLEPHRLASR